MGHLGGPLSQTYKYKYNIWMGSQTYGTTASWAHVCTFQGGHLEYVSDGQESIIRSISLDT